MHTQDASGFTITEVMIFLAISALMITIAIAGTSGSINSTRFTDSVRSFESFMQRQFDETLNGVNARTGNEVCDSNGVVVSGGSSAPGTSKECLLLGKFIHFTKGSSTITIYYIVGTRPTALDPNAGDAAAIAAAEPRVVKATTVEEYEIPWQALVYGAKREDNAAINSVALIRSPQSSSIYTYTFNASTPPDDLTPLLTAVNTNRQTNICVQSQDMFPVYGAVTLARNGRGQDAISSRLDITDSPTNGLAVLCEGTP